MSKRLTVLMLLTSLGSLALGQEQEKPYAGQQQRALKSLAPSEIQGYLAGHGMGFAKPAELNHYPGPKHVLELAQELELTTDQIGQTKQIHAEMHEEATRLGKSYVELEARLDRLFAERAVTEENMQSLISDISRLRGAIRFVHLRAHLRMVQVLGSDQIAKYDKLRGYSDGSGQHGLDPRHGH